MPSSKACAFPRWTRGADPGLPPALTPSSFEATNGAQIQRTCSRPACATRWRCRGMTTNATLTAAGAARAASASRGATTARRGAARARRSNAWRRRVRREVACGTVLANLRPRTPSTTRRERGAERRCRTRVNLFGVERLRCRRSASTPSASATTPRSTPTSAQAHEPLPRPVGRPARGHRLLAAAADHESNGGVISPQAAQARRR